MMRDEAMVVEMSADQRENPAEKRGSADNRQYLRRGNFSADNTIQMSKTSSVPTKTPSYPSLSQGNFWPVDLLTSVNNGVAYQI